MIAVIGLLMTACGGGGGVPVKVKAYNNNGVVPVQAQQMAFKALAAGPFMDIMPFADHASFNNYNSFYDDKLGGYVGSHNVTKFLLGYDINAILSDGSCVDVGVGGSDFTKGLTIAIGDIPADITVSALELRVGMNYISGWPTVEFGWPSGLPDSGDHGLTKVSSKASVGFIDLNPGNVNSMRSLSDSNVKMIGAFIYYGLERKLNPGKLTGPGGYEMGDPDADNIVIPFNPVNITSGTSSVTLNISWDLSGIVEQYKGPDGTPNTADDIFILKKGWWNGLYLYASAN